MPARGEHDDVDERFGWYGLWEQQHLPCGRLRERLRGRGHLLCGNRREPEQSLPDVPTQRELDDVHDGLGRNGLRQRPSVRERSMRNAMRYCRASLRDQCVESVERMPEL